MEARTFRANLGVLLMYLVAFAWPTLALAGTPFDDGFVGDKLDAKWQVSGEVSLGEGFLYIHIPANGNDDGSKMLQSLGTPFPREVSVILKLDYKSVQNYLQAGLVIWDSPSKYVKLARVYNNGNYFEFGGPGLSGGTLGRDEVDASEIYLGLHKQDEAVKAFFSTDGKHWTQIGGTAYISLTQPKVGFAASSWSEATGVAKIDAFWVVLGDAFSE